MVMPGAFTGRELADRLLAAKPGLKAIITSGYNTDEPDLSEGSRKEIAYLPKPCPPATLTSTIRECLRRS
jgi:hypothetical protein